MTPHLPFILLFVISYLLSVNSPIFAQEITPTVTPSLEESTAKSQKNFLEEFINSLTEKKIPESVSRINKTQLPMGIDIKGKESEEIDKDLEKDEEMEALGTKENVDSSPVVETAAQYTAANALGQPNKGVSSNIVDFFKSIFGGILDIFGVIKKGDDEAKGVIDAKIPLLLTPVEGFGEKKQGKAMEEGVSKLKCLYLPMGMCKEESASE